MKNLRPRSTPEVAQPVPASLLPHPKPALKPTRQAEPAQWGVFFTHQTASGLDADSRAEDAGKEVVLLPAAGGILAGPVPLDTRWRSAAPGLKALMPFDTGFPLLLVCSEG